MGAETTILPKRNRVHIIMKEYNYVGSGLVNGIHTKFYIGSGVINKERESLIGTSHLFEPIVWEREINSLYASCARELEKLNNE